MITLKELGKKTKLKYPEYQNIDDVELGRKIAEKYPEYQSSLSDYKPQNKGFFGRVGEDLKKRAGDVVQTFKETAAGKINPLETGIRTVGTAIGVVGDVIGEGIAEGAKNLPRGVKNAGVSVLQSAAGQQALKAISAGVNAWELFKVKNPRIAKDVEGVINIASIFPATKGARVAGKAGVASAKAGVNIGKTVAKAAEKIGEATRGTGEVLYGSALNLSAREAAGVQAYKAANPVIDRIKAFFTGESLPGEYRTTAKTAIEKGIAGTGSMIGIQAKTKAKELWDGTIVPAVNSIEGKISKNDLFGDVQKSIKKIADPSKRASLNDALNAIKDDYKNIRNFSYHRAQQIKSELQQMIPEKMFNGKNVTGSYNNLRKMIADSIRERTYKALNDINIKKAYLDYGNLKNLMDVGIKDMTKAKLKGGFGGFVSGIYNMSITPIATIGGQVLYKTGNGLKFIGEKGLKVFGDYLKKFVK